jgi:glycosyltransferase involved in cell wall biosynthesis
MQNKPKVFLDPSNRVWYSTFYIHGIISEFGRENVSFSSQYFNDLKRDEESFSFYLAIVIVSPDKNHTRIIIDYHDKPIVMQSAYEWSDIYAKININDVLTDCRFYDKMVSIPPGFGINLWNYWESAYFCFTNYLKIWSSKHVIWKRFFRDYYVQKKREKLENYLISKPDREISSGEKPYVFLIGQLWPHQHCIDQTNLMRKNFIETCQQGDCEFEGGFLATKQHPQYEEFKHLCFLKPYSTATYLKKTKESAIVFNTPTVHNCHGWKLGEFLAMGKAIISTPLSNRLPENLVHGENIHFISSIDELESSIQLLLNNSDYRKKLELGAKAYYEKYADPQQVIQRILNGPTLSNQTSEIPNKSL